MRASNCGCIDLWCAFLADAHDPHHLAKCGALLSDDEWRRHARFYFQRDRHRYLITRALVRTVLSRYAPIAPTDWIFSANDYGRPLIANQNPEARQITFNLSHTEGLVVLAVARGRDLGVDVENVHFRSVSIDLADLFFAADEATALRALPRTCQQQRFFEYWTLKESYVKARRMGLSLPLSRFSFHFHEKGLLRFAIDRELEDAPSRWQFWVLQPTSEHLIALCAERSQDCVLHLSSRRIVPMLTEESCDYPIAWFS